jgi:DNA-binding transcriptional regulator YbjK
MGREPSTVREKILRAAIDLLRESGLKKLAQPQVARAAGVPQGHLTYYFPRKLDLLTAVTQRFVEMVGHDLEAFVSGSDWSNAHPTARSRALALASHLVKDRERTRMLLGLVMEAEADPALRQTMIRSMGFTRSVLARVLGRSEEDPEVDMVQATFWGLGLQHLLYAGIRTDEQTDALIALIPEIYAMKADDKPTE